MRRPDEPVPTLTDEQIAALVSTFREQPPRKQRRSVPHMVLVDGKQIQVASKKCAWPSAGAARNALINHVEHYMHLAKYPAYPDISCGPLGSLTTPPERPRGYRGEIAPARLLVAALLATGRVKIVPIQVG